MHCMCITCALHVHCMCIIVALQELIEISIDSLARHHGLNSFFSLVWVCNQLLPVLSIFEKSKKNWNLHLAMRAKFKIMYFFDILSSKQVFFIPIIKTSKQFKYWRKEKEFDIFKKLNSLFWEFTNQALNSEFVEITKLFFHKKIDITDCKLH